MSEWENDKFAVLQETLAFLQEACSIVEQILAELEPSHRTAPVDKKRNVEDHPAGDGLFSPSKMRTLRKQMHLSQAMLGERLGLTQTQISRLERGMNVRLSQENREALQRWMQSA